MEEGRKLTTLEKAIINRSKKNVEAYNRQINKLYEKMNMMHDEASALITLRDSESDLINKKLGFDTEKLFDQTTGFSQIVGEDPDVNMLPSMQDLEEYSDEFTRNQII